MKNRSLASQLIVFILSGAALIFLSAFTYNYGNPKRQLSGTLSRALST